MPKPSSPNRALSLSIACALALAAPGAGAARKAPAVTPACSDFHAFANQDWLAAHAIVAGKGMESALGELAGHARQQQVDLLNEIKHSAQAGVPKLLGEFWASGLAEAAALNRTSRGV